MYLSTKVRHGYKPYPATSKAKISKRALVSGLNTLDRLWARGFQPKDIWEHFLLTWFALSNGNVIKLSSLLGIGRTTLVYRYQRFTGKYAFSLRRGWQLIGRMNKKSPFHKQLLILYKQFVTKPSLTPKENQHLVGLWTMGFPEKVVKVHYAFWMIREGYSRQEIIDRLDKTTRTLYRLMVFSLKKGGPVDRWLYPVKNKRELWIGLRKPGRHKKKAH
jgi:hypothetical protein